MSIENKLIGPAVGVASGGWALHVAKLFDRDIFPPITHHIGDFNLVLTPVVFSGIVGRGIENIGEKYDNNFLRRAGKYLPEIVASGIALYSTLGESMYNIIPGNTKDPWDIPAALLAAGSGYVIAKYLQKKD